jgi:glycosyltransferase involved in cell wall biosynthesis
MLHQLFNEQLLFIVFAVFCAATLLQLLYFWFFYSRIAFGHDKNVSVQKHPVSVVICARNEYENLFAFLPSILDQNYPEFEVVVVNDASDDETIYLLRDFAKKYSNLKIVDLTESLNSFKGKKFPLSIGIKSAQHEILLLTDADCVPASPDWIDRIQSRYHDSSIEVVLGYGAYQKSKGLLNKLIRFDTMRIAMSYLSLALAGISYMGVGRNLSYRKSLFYKNKGFISHYRIPSGDDDLFINQVANSKNTRIEISPESFTLSAPKTTWAEWISQKRRHLSTVGHYRFYHKVLLFLYPLSEILFYTTFLFLAILFYQPLWLFPIFGSRLFSSAFIYKRIMHRLNETNFWLLIPFFEIFFVFFHAYSFLTKRINRGKYWK